MSGEKERRLGVRCTQDQGVRGTQLIHQIERVVYIYIVLLLEIMINLIESSQGHNISVSIATMAASWLPPHLGTWDLRGH